jgi:hypothetical protein
MRWPGLVARRDDIKDTVFGESGGKRTIWKPTHGWGNKIEIANVELVCGGMN